MLKGFSRRSLSGLLVLSLLVSSLAIFPQTANAASPYDDVIQPLNGAYINSPSCINIDIAYDWYSILSDYADGGNATAQHMIDHIDNNTTGWAVTTVSNSDESYKDVVIYQWDTTTPLEFSDVDGFPHLRSNGSFNKADITCTDGEPTMWRAQSFGMGIMAVGQDYSMYGGLGNKQQPMFINQPITYPSGYEGIYAPDSYTPPSDKPVKKPDFSYQLNDKQVKAHDYANDLPVYDPDTEGYYFVGYKVEWTLYKCDPWDPYPMNLCTNSEVVDYKQLPQESDYEANVENYDEYMLEAKYLTEQCYDYDGVPDVDATPDYCSITSPLVEVPEINWLPTQIYLNINGQSITGDTTGQSCDASGYCSPALIDCTEQDNFINQLNCEFNKRFNFGLINPSLNAFKSLLNSFIVTNPQCTLPIGNVQILPGQSFPTSTLASHACASSAQFRNAFPIAPLLINFALAFLVLRMIVMIINRLMDNKKNDLIEGVN